MEKFEQYKMLEYLANSLKNTKFLHEHLLEVFDWHDSYGSKLIRYSWLQKKDLDSYSNFSDLLQFDRSLAYQKGAEFRFKLNKKAASLRNSPLSILEKRVRCIADLLALSEMEREVFAFFARIRTDDYFDDFNRCLCNRNNKLRQNASIILSIKQHKIEKMLESQSPLVKFGLLEHDCCGDVSATDLTAKLLSQNLSSVAEIKSVILGCRSQASLQWADFAHLEEKDFCAKILHAAVKNKEKGVNILLYGEPGTGKTEFAKTLAEHIGVELYAVGENFENKDRRECLNLAHLILSKDRNVSLLIDEADDFLVQEFLGFSRKRTDRKLYINRLLENNQTPVVWIINSIEDIDKAYLRRFTMVVNFSKPSLKVRTEMWRNSLKNNSFSVDKKTAEDFATRYQLSPSFIETAVKAARLVDGGLDEVKQCLNSLEKAYCNGRCVAPKIKSETVFNPALLNTDTDLRLLTERIKKLPQRRFSLCLYGASGTGKSAYAEYLAQEIGMPVLKEKCSDLLSMWVGGTEQKIAAAFAKGCEDQAVLIFDEADSFLQERQSAVRNWEITQVNEMLTQMENYPYPFVCTTNLMDSLDKASLRRFTFKVGYDYMTDAQRTMAFEYFFGFSGVDLAHLNSLAPGDFAVVKQKAEILGFLEQKDLLVQLLEQEQKNKAPILRRIGFL